MPLDMIGQDIDDLRAAIAALEGQRGTLGDRVVELAAAPLRARLGGLLRPAGLQHRQVTVLFADVVGSTALAQGLDAEDTLALFSGALQRMAALVQAHQGRVLRFTGDGVKAAFGMDEAREDDAERAVRAGLAILEVGRDKAREAQHRHGIADFAVRVGVHTGDVALGAGVEADNTAMGAAVNIAARMEQSAPPGALRISHDTWSLVRGLFALEPQPPLQVKGVDAPMQTYLVRGALERSGASVERGLQGLATPLVGRQVELQRLLHTVSRARDTRQLHALTVIGEAGLGKSRLLRELTAALAGDPTGCRVLALRSQPDGLLRPWGLLRALLARQCGVADTDGAAVARDKVVAALSPCFDARGERQAQLIGQLSGLDYGDSPHLRGLDPRALRDQAFAALRAYLQAWARGAGVPLLVAEDLHWADDGSLDLLQHLLGHAAELPLALVMTARPGLLERRPDWGTADTLLRLGPLAAASGDALAQALLQRVGDLPAQLIELVVGRAEGNPYYMEELVRRLVDDGVIVVGEPHWTVDTSRLDSVRLPGTLVGLLQARLDALPAGERQAARQASIIGHVFWDDALQALDPSAPQALPRLQRAAFVRSHDSSDFEGTVERQFDHHLLHQVTYDTLLKAERRLGHGAAARWLQARTQGRGAEFLAMTGEHAERAGETALAIDCFEQAGREAHKRFAHAAAQDWLRRALVLLGDADPARRFQLLDELQLIADGLGDRAGQSALHAEMAAQLDRHPDDGRRVRLLMCMTLLADRRGEAAASEQLARQTFELAARCGAAEWAAESQVQLGMAHARRYDYVMASAYLEIGRQWVGKIVAGSRRARAEAQLLLLSWVIALRTNRLNDARRDGTALLSIGDDFVGVSRYKTQAMGGLADIAASLGQWQESSAWAERMHALALSSGVRSGVGWASRSLGRSAAALDDHCTAIQWYLEGCAVAHAIGDRRLGRELNNCLAFSYLQQGDVGAAARCCAEAQALAKGLDYELQGCETAALAAQCELRAGRTDAALSAIDTLLDLLNGDLATVDRATAIEPKWLCYQVLDDVGDERAASWLARLHADVLAVAAALTDAADRDRLIQSVPVYRHTVAAYQRPGGRPPVVG